MRKSNEVSQMMKVIGEEGTSLKDYIEYLKGELFDSVYLQQDAFDAVDEACPAARQEYVFAFINDILGAELAFDSKEAALHFFQQVRQLFKGWNSSEFKTPAFEKIEQEISLLLEQKRTITKEISHA